MLRQTEELSGSLESLNQLDMHEKLEKHQKRRLSCPQIAFTSTLLPTTPTRKKSLVEDLGVQKVEEETLEECKEAEDNVFAEAVEAVLQEGYENNGGFEDEEDCRKHTDFLLSVMESQQRKRRGSSKSHWDDSEEGDTKIDEDVENDMGKRILWAAENNETEIVKELLAQQAALVNALDEDRYTPLHRAAYNGHASMVELLLQHNANINARTEDGWCPLHCASRWNNASVVSVLLQNGSDINAQTNGGQTALHLAASNNEAKDCLQLLLMNRHIDTTILNAANETAYDIVKRVGRLSYLFEMTEDSMQPSGS
ncbi:ankyrin repeat domain-containing protein 49-like [Acanthaster planci]|uniref:Ankyrin repeat domain-containing protein 49-like n=1 Tax=Acanthaster planci TaxID=133434 RepID=A0A8B7YWL6_ACAPL|nr:ankyrin repeat domain-containing protein 49-like [Acanthaster planci]XP_022096884.1 ankyrin repeat domain-containing protein 49-like [Acanthaster planci]XP_022096885.1 ankyrin repeat domain-containing protein 49-like [Acanthaster planci]XP_022096886.1 ankyrin repeat domain-containing protein 49-like [Acanthaster planci]XP_022096887.1 ankyrin repeat domain-containing protein 49-like [Acanthaster planci]XP_022096888.1 ankyrin repeat domain-containing protein 49-like [Acanthaster planci]XP_02